MFTLVSSGHIFSPSSVRLRSSANDLHKRVVKSERSKKKEMRRTIKMASSRCIRNASQIPWDLVLCEKGDDIGFYYDKRTSNRDMKKYDEMKEEGGKEEA